MDRHKAARTIVFCNKIDACRDVENYLRREDPQEEKYRWGPGWWNRLGGLAEDPRPASRADCRRLGVAEDLLSSTLSLRGCTRAYTRTSP